jgi:hypothetical protein
MKKLTINDIPEGYNYAAVNGNGSAYAFKYEPRLGVYAWSLGNDSFCIGRKFDNANWENSLIRKQALKRLTMGDIPKGYTWAATDRNGIAYAYKFKPTIADNKPWWVVSYLKQDDPHRIGDGFDGTDWENSLIEGDPHVSEILNNKNKRKMEGSTLQSCKFEFTQDANCLSDCIKIEKIKITHQSDLGLDRTKGGFFVLKTKGWSISSEDDIRLLLDRIRLAMKKE